MSRKTDPVFSQLTLIVTFLFFAVADASTVEPPPRPAILFSSQLDHALRKSFQDNYQEILKRLQSQRQILGRRYAEATPDQRASLLLEAVAYVERTLISQLFPAWDGTGWDFNGTSQRPGEGTIACGYFVTTLLRDAGWCLPRIKLARQPSQTIIRSVCEPRSIRILHAKPMSDFISYLESHGEGLYIVGLDTHTGFVAFYGDSIAFIHASYYRPPCAVVTEPLVGRNPLNDSKYRMVGKILGSAMMHQWLTGECIEMKVKTR